MKEIRICLLAGFLGLLSILLPTFFIPDMRQYDSPLFPAIRTGIEGISMWSFLFLLISGFGVRLFNKMSPWKIGLMTMSIFPVLAIIEILVDNTSHKMLPFEFIFYAACSIPAMIGAYFAKIIKN